MEKSMTTAEIKKLSVAERILLVEEIWDSIVADQDEVTITEAQMRELDQRLTSFETSEQSGRSWEEVKKILKPTE